MTPEEERRLRAIMNGEPPQSPPPAEPMLQRPVRSLSGIQQVWAFVVTTPDGTEGIPCAQIQGLEPIPHWMITTEPHRLELMKRAAPQIAKIMGASLTLYRWDGPRVAEQRYDPPPPPPGIDALHS